MVNAALSNWRTAPISEQLRLTLGFLEKLTLYPEEVRPADVTPLRIAGINKQAIEDAIYICTCFNIIDRIADALNFDVPSSEFFAHRAEVTAEQGYRFSPRNRSREG